MSMIVARMQKMKAENLVGIGNYNQRKTQNHSNKDIDVERSHWNYDLVEGRTRPILKGSPDELKMLLSAPEAYSWPDLRKNVLNRAIDEINLQIDDMDLQLNVGKRGRKVIHVEIANLFYPRKPNLHDEDFEPVPMVDWMKDFK